MRKKSERTSKNDNHPLHSMCSYLGSFPPHVPRHLLEKYVGPRTKVLDPFCGSGTTILEAKLCGRESIGIDLNPLAVALAQAKTETVGLDDVLYRISEIARDFRPSQDHRDVPEDVKVIFHERTLGQLCHLRESLSVDEPEDRFILGCLLGIMHGKHRKDGSSAYLSIDMPNTFSMSPNYVRKFVAENGLKRPPIDVFGKLTDRARWMLRHGSAPKTPKSVVTRGDATALHEILPQLGHKSVGAILTSPPYLGILRYGAYNWIRLWLLGFDQFEIDKSLDSTDSLDRYLSFMASFFYSAWKVLSNDGVMILVIGDVVEKNQHVPLAERLWDELDGVVPFELQECLLDDYDVDSKTTRIWGEDRKGNATPVDRILVVKKSTATRRSKNATLVAAGA